MRRVPPASLASPSLRPVSLRALLLAVFLLVAGVAAAPAASASDDQPDEKPAALKVVTIKISSNVSEDPVPTNPLGPSPLNFRAKLLQLHKLAADPAVAALRLDMTGAPDFAHTLDLLDALAVVKRAGKPIFCYADMLGDRELMIASRADHLAVPANGMLALEGLQAELMYLKGMFDKLDVRFEVLHVGDFKTAFEDLAKDGMSEEQRLTIQALLDEYWNQLVDTIASHRGISREALTAAFERVLLLPTEALAAGLIDSISSESAFEDLIEERLGGEVSYDKSYGQQSAEDFEKMMANPFAMFALLPKLLNPPAPAKPAQPYVTIVYATGPINTGKSKAGLDGKVSQMGSDTIVAALDEALEDENCRAVVLRVNSPGGSALASDLIWEAVQRVRTEKPVVSSMGHVAASGGYWISMGCDAIVAQPSTITGSIGVVSMVPDVSAVLENLGIKVEVVSAGPHGDQLSFLKHGPTPLIREIITRSMQSVYDEFLTKVATGRRMPRERAAELAQGRVWTGRQAEEVGLVDELGGLEESIALACVLGGLDVAGTPIRELPAPPSFSEALEEAFGDMLMVQSPVQQVLAQLAGLPGVEWLAPLVRSAFDSRGVLTTDRVQALLPFAITVR